MLIDLDNLFWIDMKDDDKVKSSLMMGFSIIADILDTRYAIENKTCNKYEELNPNIKYTAIFNGQGNTFKEMEKAFESEFSDIPFPELFPIIGQNNSVEGLKRLCIEFIKLQYGATKLSKRELTKDLEEKDKIMSVLIDKYMKMFSYYGDEYLN